MTLYLKHFRVYFSLLLLGISGAASAANLVRVRASEATIYSGSAETSGVEGVAHPGDEFYLRSDATANGFYKIEYQGHPAYILASQVDLVAAVPTSTPVPPTPIPPTPVPPSPTPLPPTEAPTPVPPTPIPPTVEPATPVPATPIPPTPVPPSPTDIPTVVPPTLAPTAVPTSLPTPPVPMPTSTYTKIPTPVPQILKPGSKPIKVLSAKPKGSLVQGNSFSVGSGGGIIASAPAAGIPYAAHVSSPYVFQPVVTRKPREPGEPSIGMVRLGFGLGAGGPIRPAFHPLDESADRNLDSADSYGVGVEFRSWLKFLRFFFDWSGHSMATLAAHGDQRAAAEYLGDNIQVIFPSDIEYRVTDQALRLGLKLGLPMGRFEPWVGGAIGTYFWHADYVDTGHTLSYGEANDMAFGANAMLGLDYFLLLGTSFDLIVTPYLEWGAPAIHPTIQDLAGFGADWKDGVGTPVNAPWRFGIGMGIGF